MNVEGAKLARTAADAFENRFVAGSVGPLNVTLSLSPKVDDPAFRTVDFDAVYESYAEQIRALRDGGVDLLLIETIFDTLNSKAAIAAADRRGPRTPPLDLRDDRRPQRPDPVGPDRRGVLGIGGARRADPGRDQLLPGRERDAALRRGVLPRRPGAGRLLSQRGLPNAFGGYDETPETTSGLLEEFARAGLVNLVGGCCGTTPEHTAMIAAAVKDVARREIPTFDERVPTFSGLEPFRSGRTPGS
jgi:5-methyltetrahydrofolate--homocysteine methyltransferase